MHPASPKNLLDNRSGRSYNPIDFWFHPRSAMGGMWLRPDHVNPSMRKQRLTTPHRRPGFDALEDRRLLSAGYFGAPRGEEIVVVYQPSPGFDPRATFVAVGEFPGESPMFGGLAGWGGPVSHGWEGLELRRATAQGG